jgi:pyruvate/2-oxoglutarate/acetoin dehydrogenase E1 component
MVDKLTLADTIREITRTHLEQNNGLLLGQCISAVGWVNNTVPDCKNIVEIPMTDIAGAGMAVGAALVGRRPIFVIRFQDFMILNGGPLIYYAAKLKDVHGRAAPVFIRAIGIDGIGHAHSGVLHSIFMHFPGFRVCAPITSGEYKKIWNDYLKHDDPMYVSEHRSTYQNTQEFEDQFEEGAQITLYGIASARPEVVKAAAILREQEIGSLALVKTVSDRRSNYRNFAEIEKRFSCGLWIRNRRCFSKYCSEIA